MAEAILDGSGAGYRAKVDSGNRVHAFAVSSTAQEFSATNGDTYNLNTGTINLTSGSKSACLYVKNNGTESLHISSIGYLLGNSTGGTDDLEAQVIRNPTGGTIVSGASTVDVLANKNFGSSNSITVDAYKGGEGLTLTGGEDAYYSLLPGDARAYLIDTGVLVLEPGSSIGVNVTPQSGNTSMNLQVFLAITEYKLGA